MWKELWRSNLAGCWLDTCLSLLPLQTQVHSGPRPVPGALWSYLQYLHYCPPGQGGRQKIMHFIVLYWEFCRYGSLHPPPFLAPPLLTISMQKSGRCPVIPNTVVLRYFSWPARSIKVMTLEDFSHILVQSRLPPWLSGLFTTWGHRERGGVTPAVHKLSSSLWFTSQ